MEGGDLCKLLFHKRKFREGDVKFYTAEIVLGIEHLHKMGVIYRDLKLENILIDSSGHLRITDYGLCKKFHPRQKNKREYTFCGTPHYIAPEVIKQEEHTKAVDWWSLGIMVYEMLKGATPFEEEDDESDNYMRLYDRILTQDPVIPTKFSAKAKDFVVGLLSKDPTKRLGAGKNGVDDIKRHPFFNKINWADMARKAKKAPFEPVYDDEMILGAKDNHLPPSPARSQDRVTSCSDTQTTEIPAAQTTPAAVGKTPSQKRKLSRSEDGGRPSKRPRPPTPVVDLTNDSATRRDQATE
ncbi:ribosomal protein S6 kinase alpha-5-like [Zootermopsis nevadensis]|uniref:ribosomal protein S6 kinase alpha-5-like n=1 Tax=Zootermopsis nevadensis TaxID=136037 RepID=UPI000B8E8E4F|nr:ribosomal protein S6 kinase alpha-5-like [Zootermopsis nevadensis]